MPKEVVDALKKPGRWQEGADSAGADRNDPRTRSLRVGAGAGAWADPVGRAGDRRATARRGADGARQLDRARRNSASSRCRLRALATCYVTSDFSVATVFENSHSQMPLIYKITSVWGNHEGSMLLWVLILSLFGAWRRGVRQQSAGDAEGQRAGGAVVDRLPPSISSFCSPRTRSCACRRRRSRAAISIRSCRTSASPSIRRCSISAMSASRSPSPSPSPR